MPGSEGDFADVRRKQGPKVFSHGRTQRVRVACGFPGQERTLSRASARSDHMRARRARARGSQGLEARQVRDEEPTFAVVKSMLACSHLNGMQGMVADPGAGPSHSRLEAGFSRTATFPDSRTK